MDLHWIVLTGTTMAMTRGCLLSLFCCSLCGSINALSNMIESTQVRHAGFRCGSEGHMQPRVY